LDLLEEAAVDDHNCDCEIELAAESGGGGGVEGGTAGTSSSSSAMVQFTLSPPLLYSRNRKGSFTGISYPSF
jgi:hypothetical protein